MKHIVENTYFLFINCVKNIVYPFYSLKNQAFQAHSLQASGSPRRLLFEAFSVAEGGSCGIPESRFHDLGHSYAVASLSSGDDIKTVQENLGHHTAAFTLDTYGHVTEKMKQESAARMEALIKARMSG